MSTSSSFDTARVAISANRSPRRICGLGLTVPTIGATARSATRSRRHCSYSMSKASRSCVRWKERTSSPIDEASHCRRRHDAHADGNGGRHVPWSATAWPQTTFIPTSASHNAAAVILGDVGGPSPAALPQVLAMPREETATIARMSSTTMLMIQGANASTVSRPLRNSLMPPNANYRDARSTPISRTRSGGCALPTRGRRPRGCRRGAAPVSRCASSAGRGPRRPR